jgi:hypothetical protein
MFARKKDGSLRQLVDYRALNRAMVKKNYPLPLISEMLDKLCGAWIVMKIDVWNAYHLIPIKEGDKYNTVFRTRYGQLEHQVMLFGLKTPAATF